MNGTGTSVFAEHGSLRLVLTGNIFWLVAPSMIRGWFFFSPSQGEYFWCQRRRGPNTHLPEGGRCDGASTAPGTAASRAPTFPSWQRQSNPNRPILSPHAATQNTDTAQIETSLQFLFGCLAKNGSQRKALQFGDVVWFLKTQHQICSDSGYVHFLLQWRLGSKNEPNDTQVGKRKHQQNLLQ